MPRHDDTSYRTALRAVKSSGQGVALILDVLSDAKITLEELFSVRDALHGAWARNEGAHIAWVRTPQAPSNSRVLHAWYVYGPPPVGSDNSPVLGAACREVMGAYAGNLVSEHKGRMKQHGDHSYRECRSCQTGLRSLKRNDREVLSFSELYSLAADLGTGA